MTARIKRTLDKDLPLEERKRKLAPILDSTNLDLGISMEAVKKQIISEMAPEDVEKWHITTDEDTPLAVKVKIANGYEACKDKKGKQYGFKGDVFWRIPKDIYEKRLLHNAYMGNRQAEESLVDDGDAKGEAVANTLT